MGRGRRRQERFFEILRSLVSCKLYLAISTGSAGFLSRPVLGTNATEPVAVVKCCLRRCGHCKRMKPDWDKLMAAFEGHKTTLVADVDCTAGGEALCQEH